MKLSVNHTEYKAVFILAILFIITKPASAEENHLTFFSFLRGSRAPAYASSSKAWAGLTLTTGAAIRHKGRTSVTENLNFLWNTELLGAVNSLNTPPDWTYERCQDDTDCPEKKHEPWFLLPGKNLYAGFECGPFCEIRIGKTENLSRLSGSAVTGVHLFLKAGEAGNFLVSSGFDPAAARDGFLSEDSRDINFSHLNRRSSIPLNIQSDAIAHRIGWQSLWSFFYSGLSFETAGFRSPEPLPDPAVSGDKEYNRYFIKRADTVTATGGISVKKENWFADAGIGFRQIYGETAAKWKTFTASPYRLSGQAVTGEITFQYFWFTAGAEIFLPEPAVRKGGSKGEDTEKSGFLLIGNSPVSPAIAGGLADLRPAPGYCSGKNCHGPYSETRALFGFQSHAGTASFFAEIRTGRFKFKNNLFIIKPLKPRTDERSSPWRNLTPDPESSHFYELNSELHWTPSPGFSAFIKYARLLQKNKTHGLRLAAEDALIGIQIPFYTFYTFKEIPAAEEKNK